MCSHMNDNPFEFDKKTWAYILKQHWDVFNRICDEWNEEGHQGKLDKYKWREYILWYMQRRHDEEIKKVKK